MQQEQRDKKRSASINKQLVNIYGNKDRQKFYCQQQKKDIKSLVMNQKMKSSENTVLVSQSVSLQHVLKELARTSPKQIVLKHFKKTPSTSLHTPADFSKRNEQSCLKKKMEHNTQSPQTSYRSRLQLTKRNLWIDLINNKSQAQSQADQIAGTEYKTNMEVSAILVSDWKQPYFPIMKRDTMQINEQLDRPEESHDFQRWKDILNKKIERRRH